MFKYAIINKITFVFYCVLFEMEGCALEDILEYFFNVLNLSYFSDLLYKLSDEDFKKAVRDCEDSRFSLAQWKELYEYLFKQPCPYESVKDIKEKLL